MGAAAQGRFEAKGLNYLACSSRKCHGPHPGSRVNQNPEQRWQLLQWTIDLPGATASHLF
jgi:hypothetical protein